MAITAITPKSRAVVLRFSTGTVLTLRHLARSGDPSGTQAGAGVTPACCGLSQVAPEHPT